MYTRVLFLLFCFPAAGVGPLAAARGLTAERGRTRLCRGSQPLPPRPPVQEPPLGSCTGRALLASQGLPSSPGGGRRPLPTPAPACSWFTVMMLGEWSQRAASRRPSSAGSGHTASGRCYPAPQSRRMEKSLSFLRNVFVFSLRTEELCPSPSGAGPSSSKSVVQ